MTERQETGSALVGLLGKVRAAQVEFSTYPQEKVDAIFKAAATAANSARIMLADNFDHAALQTGQIAAIMKETL